MTVFRPPGSDLVCHPVHPPLAPEVTRHELNFPAATGVLGIQTFSSAPEPFIRLGAPAGTHTLRLGKLLGVAQASNSVL